MKKVNILIYPTGAENATEVYNSIKDSIPINVIRASGKKDHSDLIYDHPVEGLFDDLAVRIATQKRMR